MLTLLILRGIKESIFVNNVFTVTILFFFLYCDGLGIAAYDSKNKSSFFIHGVHGTMRAAAIVFFGYTSFEQPVTVAEEAVNPRRDLPKSLNIQIVIETIQYSLLAFLVSG